MTELRKEFVSLRLDPQVIQALKSEPNRSEFIRAAIATALQQKAV